MSSKVATTTFYRRYLILIELGFQRDVNPEGTITISVSFEGFLTISPRE